MHSVFYIDLRVIFLRALSQSFVPELQLKGISPTLSQSQLQVRLHLFINFDTPPPQRSATSLSTLCCQKPFNIYRNQQPATPLNHHHAFREQNLISIPISPNKHYKISPQPLTLLKQMEPRQRPRAKGPQFPHHELASILYACGDHHTPLPDTVNCLDEIITDYVIELCHEADLHARTATRSKVKVDDFQFALRHDARKLGRIVELLEVKRAIDRKTDMFKTQNSKAQAAKAGVTGDKGGDRAVKTGGGLPLDEEDTEFADLVESGRSKKGKAKALRELEASTRETAAAAAARRRALEAEAEVDLDLDLDVDADGDVDMD
jgi:transcription initiation factor TFIID subunit 13